VLVAFLSASQDVVIDAYKADVLAPHERAAGSAMYVLGYRVAVLLSGTLALILADQMPWRLIYLIMAAFMVIGIVGTLVADEPSEPANPPRTIIDAVVQPFAEFGRRLGWAGFLLVIGFAALYRFGDHFAQALTMAFLKREIGFSLTDIALVTKVLGFVGTALGGLAAGSLVARFGLRRMLVAFGALAAVTNLLYAWLAVAGANMPIFWTAVFVDHAANALGTAAFLAVLMSVCSPAVSATQFALLTSLSSVGQRVFGPLADDVVHAIGWPGFFASTAAMALPGLILAWRVSKDVKADA
jgi:MFS transporter, PAT family, beta-lactamase induction signal transducer AmpG